MRQTMYQFFESTAKGNVSERFNFFFSDRNIEETPHQKICPEPLHRNIIASIVRQSRKENNDILTNKRGEESRSISMTLW
jgi:hypothetical protein